MDRERLRRNILTVDNQLALNDINEATEAMNDWIAVIREELRDGGAIPILALALAELVRQYEHAISRGTEGLAQSLRKHLADCATAILKAEDGLRPGSDGTPPVTSNPPRTNAGRKKSRPDQSSER